MDEGQLSTYCTPKLGLKWGEIWDWNWDEICSRDQEQHWTKSSLSSDLLQTWAIKHKLRSSQVSLMSPTADLPDCVGLSAETHGLGKISSLRGLWGFLVTIYLAAVDTSSTLNHIPNCWILRGCLDRVSDLMRSRLAQNSSSWSYSACWGLSAFWPNTRIHPFFATVLVRLLKYVK